MKINFTSLFQQDVKKFRLFLIFGNDESVFERSLFFLQKKLSSSLRRQTEASFLSSSLSQPSLFETSSPDDSLTLIPHVTDKILKKLEDRQEGRFIFTSLKARAQSKLVTEISQIPTALAIAAYLSPITPSEFAFLTQQMTLPKTFQGALYKAHQNDPMGLLGALEKIKLFGDVSDVPVDLFFESITSFQEFTPLIHSFLLKDIKEAVNSGSYLTSSDLISFLRLLSRSFQTLLNLLCFKEKGLPISWQKLSSPVFFKEQPVYETALSKWSSSEVLKFVRIVLFLERKIKFSGYSTALVKGELFRSLK